MIISHGIVLFHKHVLARENRVYTKEEMISWVKVVMPMANSESIAREHRQCKEDGLIDYMCFDTRGSLYKAVALIGEKKGALLDFSEDVEEDEELKVA
jgi:hypothetical protein